jgi:hypothetical protein
MQNHPMNQQPSGYQQPAHMSQYGDPEEKHRDRLALLFLIFIGCILVPVLLDLITFFTGFDRFIWKITWVLFLAIGLVGSSVLLFTGLRVRDKGWKAVILVISILTLVFQIVHNVMINPFFDI